MGNMQVTFASALSGGAGSEKARGRGRGYSIISTWARLRGLRSKRAAKKTGWKNKKKIKKEDGGGRWEDWASRDNGTARRVQYGRRGPAVPGCVSEPRVR